jgi:diadenylate cyclase
VSNIVLRYICKKALKIQNIVIGGILNIFKDITWSTVMLTVIDVVIVSIIFYFVLRAIQHTRTLQLAEGIALYFIAVALLARLSTSLNLVTFSFLMNGLLTFSLSFLPFLLVVVFQPELRKWFTGLGKGIMLPETSENGEDYRNTVEEIVKSVNYMSLNKIGAIIVVERSIPLNDYIETGVPINSLVKSEILNTIFFPNTVLHDGAVIIRNGRIVAARCVLPLSMDKSFDESNLGIRHRAAAGISEETDAISVVVSEETGIISLAVRGKLTRYLSPLELRGMLLVMARPVEVKGPKVKK